MKKILLSLLIVGGVQYSFAMQGGFGGGAAAAQSGAAQSTLSEVNKQLIEAAKQGNAEAVKALLERGANVNAQDKQGWTALMYAAQNECIEVVKVLLDSNADVNEQNAHGWTALMNAAFCGHVDFTGVIRELLEQSADVNLQNTDGRKAIDYAHGKKKEMILLNAQADKVSSEPKISNRQPAPSSASASRAASGSTARASAGGGVTRTVGGAGQTVDKTLCTEVSAKILADAVSQTDDLGSQSAGTQTEPIQVGPSQATAQERLSSRLKSAFSKPSLSGKPSRASKMDCDETSVGIVKPIAVRPNIAPQVGAIQVFYLQTLIAMARANGAGLSGLIQLLNSAANVYFDASEAARLVAGLGFDNSFFATTGNAPITGLDLATLLNNSISSILGTVDAASGFTAEQTAKFQILEAFFNQLP